MKFFLPIIILTIFYLIKKFLKDKYVLLSQTGDRHQKFVNRKNIPLLGGFLIFFSYCSLFYTDDQVGFITLSSLIFFLGIISDLKIIKSASLRLFIQFIVVYTMISVMGFTISPLRIIFIDNLNQNLFFNYFFITFCILILLNGSNFIDGLNGLCLGYYLLIFISLNFLDLNIFQFNYEQVLIFMIILIILLILNYSNQLFIGDSGSYFLGIFFSYNLIQIYNTNIISPFYIALLLWYPCFELLFSIIRKFNFKKSPMKPDTNHLHQLIFLYIKKNYINNSLYSNNFASFIILIYNLIIFYIASKNSLSSEIQIMLILISILVYCIIYVKLLNWKKKT